MKKIVKYDATKGVQFVDNSAIVHPIDHPDTQYVSNTVAARTSQVVKRNYDGSFETLNTLYIPAMRSIE